MLDLRFIREHVPQVKEALVNKNSEADVDKLLALDTQRRELITRQEQLQQERNRASKEIGQRAKQGEDVHDMKEAVRSIGQEISTLEEAKKNITTELNDILQRIPNIPHHSVPVGHDETANVCERHWGDKRTFSFEPKAHWDIGDHLGIFDFPRAAKMTGTGFAILKGQGAKLQRALIQFMLDLHTREHGYTEVLPPFVCNTEAMTGTGQLPKMQEDMYEIPKDDLWMIPTAEVPLTNLYRDEIMEEPLPVSVTGYTPCFRREAGAAGKMTRGLNRLHQFDKVELVKFVKPEESYQQLEQLLSHAERVLQLLQLPYRILNLCTGDLSFASAKTYDIEVWAPGQNTWLEVSSCSNFEDFQARRANIRYRDEDGKPAFVHTLNGSGVALPRLMVAILENYQQEDGRVHIPEALKSYMPDITHL